MLRKIMLIFLFSNIACSVPSHSEDRVSSASDVLAAQIDSVNYIEIFILSRTGDYSYANERIKKEAGTRILRKCGGNCQSFMRDVIKHLSDSVPAECVDGQQDVLIGIGADRSIVYSHSGRISRFERLCYFNERGIRSIITSPSFLFN